MIRVPHDPRRTWTSRPPSVSAQDGARAGVAVHWPGYAFTDPTHADCLDHVAAIERSHLASPEGYGAIAYCQLVCHHGRVIEGRGAAKRSGANGDAAANARYGSVCALVPTGGAPNDAMLTAIRAALRDQAPGTRLVTHNQVRPEPTACPGPVLTRWVESGAWRDHARQKGDPMPDPKDLWTYDVPKGDESDRAWQAQTHLRYQTQALVELQRAVDKLAARVAALDK